MRNRSGNRVSVIDPARVGALNEFARTINAHIEMIEQHTENIRLLQRTIQDHESVIRELHERRAELTD